MSTKYPVTRRDDVLPGPNPITKKHIPEGWGAEEDSVNKPNDPQKRYRPTAFNVTDDYHDDKADPDSIKED